MRANNKLTMALMGLALAGCGGGSDGEPATSEAGQPATSQTIDFSDQEIPSQLAAVTGEWDTDFSKATIDLDELVVGIGSSDPRDLIPPIDAPNFEVAKATSWLADREPGVSLVIADDARFYPLSVLTRHEIVNDTVGDTPVAVTYCPLCNSAVAFDRRHDGAVLRLGVSGLLRHSDLVMWDDRTGTLWQQVTGEAIVGAKAGARLDIIPAAIVRWADFVATYPEGLALAEDQGFGIPYGSNPYEFYSSRSSPFGFYTGEIDDRFPALERVVGVVVDDEAVAYPFSELQTAGAVNDVVAGREVVVMWGAPDTADALDSGTIAEARSVGTGVAYSRIVDGETLTFEARGGGFVDLETGSSWSILGKSVSGPLHGAELEIVTHHNEFWFAWQAFFPEAAVWIDGSAN